MVIQSILCCFWLNVVKIRNMIELKIRMRHNFARESCEAELKAEAEVVLLKEKKKMTIIPHNDRIKS